MRNTGIQVIERVPWGTHICHFYRTREDLLEVLIPFMKAGLENNEYCIWITSAPLPSDEAAEVLKKKIKDFHVFQERGQIEILDASEWYTKTGAFNADTVLKAWHLKEAEAIERGYEGLRATGNLSWLGKNSWKKFAKYEEKIHNLNGRYRMLAIFSYPENGYGASRVFELVASHKFALLKRNNKLQLIENSESKKADEILRESEERWRLMIQNTSDIIITVDRDSMILATNRAVLKLTNEQVIWKKIYEFIAPEHCEVMKSALNKVLQTGKPETCTLFGTGRDGPKTAWYETLIIPIKDNGEVIAETLVLRDISYHKLAEEALQHSEKKFQREKAHLNQLFEDALVAIVMADKHGRVLRANREFCRVFGYNTDEIIGQSLDPLVASEKYLEEAVSITTRAARGEKVIQDTVRKKKDGTEFGVRVLSSPIFIDGELTATFAVYQEKSGNGNSSSFREIRDEMSPKQE